MTFKCNLLAIFMPFWNAVGHTESNIQYIFPADDFEIMTFHLLTLYLYIMNIPKVCKYFE